MKQLKIGMIGLGGIADFHSAGIRQSSDAMIWSVCDIDQTRLDKRSEEWGVPPSRTYTDYRKLLQDPELDAVTIGTPNDSHFTIAMEAIRQRKPFALEKPVTLQAAEALTLKEALEANPLPHMICFSYRYKSAARYARELVRSGKLGTIRHVYAEYLQGWGISPEVPLLWRFQQEQTGSGAMGDLGCHILDLIRFLVGDTRRILADAGTIVSERERLDGSGKGPVDVDDYCHVLSRLDGGVSAVMSISRFAYGRGNYQRVEIYGSEGALVYRLEEEDSLRVRLSGEGHGDFVQAEIPGSCRTGQQQAFFDLLLGRSDGLNADMTDGYINQLTVDAILESFTGERWITIPQL